MVAPLEVFCCYAREDQEMLAHLKKHLVPLERQGQITIWSDANLNAGVEWEKELHQHLESASIILLLISPDFMASDYCYSTEMERAITRHNEGSAVVIPLLLRSTFWQNAPFAKLQMVPANAKPVTSWLDRDDALNDITIQINWVVSELRTKRVLAEADESTLGQQTSNRETSPTPLATNVEARQTIAALQRTLSERLSTMVVLHTLEDISSIEGVALSADGLTLASCSKDKTVKLWNAQTGQLLHTLTGHTALAYNLALSADGLTLASGSDDRTVKLWDAQTGQLLHTLTGHTSFIGSLALSADGLMLASGSGDGMVMLWNAQTGQLLHTLTDHAYWTVSSLALSADGLTLASGSKPLGYGTVKLWNTQTGQFLRTLTDQLGPIGRVTLSADGLTLASDGQDRTVKLWNAQNGQLLRTLTGHSDRVRSVALSADGLTLASSSAHLVKLWNVQTRQLLCSLNGHSKDVNSVALSADGLTLASGGEDQTISIWGVKA